MSKNKIYLAGSMTAFEDNPEMALEWREWFSDRLSSRFNVINPAKHFWLMDDEGMTEREAMNWDLRNVKNSDLIVVNFNAPSIGTDMEIATAYNLGIPIIGLNEDNMYLHPWEQCMLEHLFYDKESMLEYINFNY